MKKNLIALAATALAGAPALAAEFQPAPGTKFEVNIEVAAYHQARKNSNGINKKQIMGAGLNQIEIKGEHRISGDLSVFGEIEVDYDPLADNNAVLTDDMRIGLNSKQLGRFSAGQFDSYFEDNVMEILGVHHGDKALVSEPGGNNDGRHVQYVKGFGDFTLALDFMNSSNNGTATSQDTKNGNAITLAYKLGNLTLAAGSSKIAGYKSEDGQTALQVTSGKVKSVTGLSARYRLGDLTLLGLTATEKQEATGLSNKYNGLGLIYKFGQFDISSAYQRVKAGTSATRNETMVGLGYTPAKNLTFFMDVAKLKKAKGQDDAVEIGVKYAF